MVNGAGKVLLVDDEQIVISVGRQMLEKLGYSVITAASGPEALEVYPANKDDITLVILDMIMPGLGAADTYDWLKAINAQVKVLLSSGYGADQQATEILNRGCNGFIQKPFNLQGLSDKIGEILGATG